MMNKQKQEIRITSVKRRGPFFFSVVLQNETAPVRFHPDLVRLHRVGPERSFVPDEWIAILRENQRLCAMHQAMTLLSSRAHGESELETKLRQKGFPASVVKETLLECRRLSLIDDRKFAMAYAEELRSRGIGSRRIVQELRKRRIEPGIIDEIISGTDGSETAAADLSAARDAMERKLRVLKNETDPRKKREKLARHLISRGFPAPIVFRIIREEDEEK
jgi:regulatory protein